MPRDDGRRHAILHGPTLEMAWDTPEDLARLIGRRVSARPDGLIQSFGLNEAFRSRTFAQCWGRAGAIATDLRAAGVQPGTPVVLLLADVVDHVPAFWACLRAGMIAVPFEGVAYAALRRPEDARAILVGLDNPVLLADGPSAIVTSVAAMCPGARILAIADDDRAVAFDDRPTPSRPCCLIPTSGSTGRIKLAALSGGAIAYRQFSKTYSNLGTDDACLGVFPFDSITGYRVLFLQFAAWTQLSRSLLATRPAAIFDAIERFGITHVQVTSTLARQLCGVAADLDLSPNLRSLRSFGLGGEAVTRQAAVDLAAMVARLGAPGVLNAGYGTTETGPLLVGVDPSTSVVDVDGNVALGGVAAGVSLRIIGEDGAVLGEGVTGTVEVLCPQKLFSGYWGESAHCENNRADGWWRTGDLGKVEDGAFTFRGRANDVVNVAGRKIALACLDAHLATILPAGQAAYALRTKNPKSISDAIAVALVADPEAGDPSEQFEAIGGAVRHRFELEPITFLVNSQDLPLTPTGKVDRAGLAALWSQADEGSRFGAPAKTAATRTPDTIEEAMSSAWREALGHEAAPGQDFFEAGGDSFAVLQLGLSWERLFDTPMPNDLFRGAATIQAMVAALTGDDETAIGTMPPADDLATVMRRQVHLLENWVGTRETPERLLIGRPPPRRWPPWRAMRELAGKRSLPRDAVPMFFVLQHGNELALLFEHLGRDVPIYGLRSGKTLFTQHETIFTEMVALYVEQIRGVRPHGPYIIGGTCQGCLMAVAIARMLRRTDAVQLLVLIDFDVARSFAGRSYDSPVAVIAAERSHFNPFRQSTTPTRDWLRIMSGGVSVRVIDAAYAEVFTPSSALALSEAIKDACRWATSGSPARPLSDPSASSAQLAARTLPQ